MGWEAEGLWFDPLQGQIIYLVSEASKLALNFNRPPVQWVSGSACFECRPEHGYSF